MILYDIIWYDKIWYNHNMGSISLLSDLRLPLKRLAIFSKKLFWGAMSPFLSGARCTTAACFVVAAETARGCNKDCYIISELVPWELSIGLSCGRGGWWLVLGWRKTIMMSGCIPVGYCLALTNGRSSKFLMYVWIIFATSTQPKVGFDTRMTLHTTTTHHRELNVSNISAVTVLILTKL